MAEVQSKDAEISELHQLVEKLHESEQALKDMADSQQRDQGLMDVIAEKVCETYISVTCHSASTACLPPP